tara:strand:- start:1453 stop:1794 length:342 start_codon:yes stop_codon:yes gene_type:complete
MDDLTIESWQDKIRRIASDIQNAEFAVFKAEADIKKLQANLELQAMSTGAKTISAQKMIADNNPKLYDARLKHGTAKGNLSGLKIQLRALEVGFEEWRTKNANIRSERSRYGA